MSSRPITGIVDQDGNADDHRRHAVAKNVKVRLSAPFRFEDFDEQRIQLKSFQEHPREGGQEEVVEETSDDAAGQPILRLSDTEQEDQLGDH